MQLCLIQFLESAGNVRYYLWPFWQHHPIRCELRLSMGWSHVMHGVVQNGESNASPFSIIPPRYHHGSARLLELVPDFSDDLNGNAD